MHALAAGIACHGLTINIRRAYYPPAVQSALATAITAGNRTICIGCAGNSCASKTTFKTIIAISFLAIIIRNAQESSAVKHALAKGIAMRQTL